MKFSARKYSAFTLIELIVVVAIMAIITAAVLPTIGVFGRGQVLLQSTETLASNLRLAKEKSASGVVINPTTTADRVWWGLNCVSGDTKYSLGYTLLDSNMQPTSFVSIQTIDLSPDKTVTFGTGSCNGFPIYFRRITGEAIVPSDPTNIKVFSNTTENMTVTINRSGNIFVTNSYTIN